MDLHDLANEFIGATNEADGRRILAENEDVSKIDVAYAIKEICYASWTKEPIAAQKAASSLQILSQIANNKEIDLIASWITGIAKITEGKIEDALRRFDDAQEGFKRLGKKHEAAQTQVAQLIPLGLLGDYERAIGVGTEALAVFESLNDDLAAGKIEMNLAIVAARQGNYKVSKDYCIAARDRFEGLGDTKWIVVAENDLAIALAELNEFPEAEERYLRALDVARRDEMHLMEASILGGLGNLQTFRGKYGDALRYLEMSRRKFDHLAMPHQSAIADLEIAEIYQILNLTGEAFEIYKRVTRLLKEFKLRGEEARSRANAGKLALLNGEYTVARSELQKAVALFKAEENPAGQIFANLLQARLENETGRSEIAFGLVEKADQLLDSGHFPRLELEAGYMSGETLRLLARNQEAETVLTKVVARAKESEQLNIEASSLVALAKLALVFDDPETAVNRLKEAISVVEGLRDPIPAEEFRMTFFADKLAPFEMLSRVLLSRDDIEGAFVYAERAKARTLVEAVDAREGRQSSVGDPSSALREKLNWHYAQIARKGEADTTAVKEIARIEKLLADLKLREASMAASVKIPSQKQDWDRLPEQLIKKLGEDRAILEFTNHAGRFSGFVVDSGGVKHVENVANETEVIELLEGFRFQIEAMRYEEPGIGGFADQLSERATGYLRELYDLLIAPFKDILKEKQLIVVPVSSLFYVPFNALYDGANYLIETREIVISPGSAVWNKLAGSARIKPQSALVVAFEDETIPLVVRESKAVSKQFDKAKVLSGKDATTVNYLRFSPEYDVVHLACHGAFRPDNPMYSHLRLNDGFLTVRDVAAGRLKAELITLSACETGLNKVFAGNEILGLARGFLSAGAKNVVMSLWTVNDAATEQLMSDFYSCINNGKSIPSALRTAQCNQIAARKHPYFWAPFGMIGI